MNILFDGIVFSIQRYGGISVYFHELLRCLSSANVSADILIEDPTCQSFEMPQGGNLLSRDARILERYRLCRVHTASAIFHSSYYRRPSINSIPSVVTVHDFVYERYARGPKRWVHMHQKHAAIRAAQAVICISESTRQDMLEFVGEIPGQAVHVIHNGVSDVFCPLSLSAAPVPPYVLYVGERRGYKNFMQLLAAMELLPDLELHCVGGGALRAEELAAMPVGTKRRIKHLGFVTDEALNEHYNRALCLVYPSSYEGFGIPVVEAMRAGCPVVSTQCKAIMEVGGDALTVAADADRRALADSVLRLASVEYRNQMVSKGFEVSKHFSWDKTHEGTLAVYKSLGASPG